MSDGEEEKSENERLQCFAVSAAPCGHCRQFLLELYKGTEVLVILGKGEKAIRKSVGDLLPDNFSPKDLGNTTPLLGHGLHHIEVERADAVPSSSPTGILLHKAIEAASHSYSPYTNSPAGIALRTRDGKFFKGAYVENVAYNPSLSPLQSAITGLVAEGQELGDIEECVLVERRNQRKQAVCQENTTRMLLGDIAPGAALHVFAIAG